MGGNRQAGGCGGKREREDDRPDNSIRRVARQWLGGNDRAGGVTVPFPFFVTLFLLPRYHPIDTMATMAAAIAASLPTVQAAPAPVAPTQENLPTSWNKSVDPEAEIPVTTVQIDGLVSLGIPCERTGSLNNNPPQVTTKIIKHSLDFNSSVHGLLLGLDLGGVLEISNCFPLPNQPPDEDEKSLKSVGRYIIPHEGADIHAHIHS